jgi:hypothetical protein
MMSRIGIRAALRLHEILCRFCILDSPQGRDEAGMLDLRFDGEIGSAGSERVRHRPIVSRAIPGGVGRYRGQ